MEAEGKDETMKGHKFELHISYVSGNDVAGMAFHALVAAAWAIYQSQLIVALALGQSPTDEEKMGWVTRAFLFVIDPMPSTNVFKAELDRYLQEVVKVGSPTPLLLLN